MTSSKRANVLPEVPTVTEAGLAFEAGNWYSLMAPKGTPKPVVDYLQQQVAKALASSDVKEGLLARGAEAAGGMPPDEFARVIASEAEHWGGVFRSLGLKAQ
ncbi:MAG: hypothetical protein IPO58_24330 [Betaproteobacteria bacterium]|nr:hypothetical protein [Betaproteobacteria bacterium]